MESLSHHRGRAVKRDSLRLAVDTMPKGSEALKDTKAESPQEICGVINRPVVKSALRVDKNQVRKDSKPSFPT